uniref:Cytochrome c biogenesis protein CcsB n=1 Tax=Antithamnionella ternifolia TaxID=207919 RepID=A0A4D6WK74_9FLOR|nr:cytochrome c biogenesis protein ccs1 [Antithamnionella ternifolia]
MKKKNIAWTLTKNLANLNFAIFILFIICIFSLLGSLIEQDQSLLYYQLNYPINKLNIFTFSWNLIIFFGLDHLYNTWWFICILILLSLSLITCTLSTQLPSLSNSRRWKFLSSVSYKKKSNVLHKLINTDSSLINMIYSLNLCNYYTFNREYNIYGYKGLMGRIAPIIVHISIIVTLLGSTVGLFYGFNIQEMVPKGEVFHLKNIVKSGRRSLLPSDLIFRVEDFYITYNSNNSIQQFFSKISILNHKGKSIFFHKISVNSPCKFRGLTIYQTDWQINGLRFQLEEGFLFQNKLSQIKLNNKVISMAIIPININQKVILLVKDLNSKIEIYNLQGKILHIVNLNQQFDVDGYMLIIKEIMVSTGLQIKSDPGVIIVYLGFGLLMISTFISYLSYSQIWVNYSQNDFELFGSTNRAILFFEEELVLIYNRYLNNTSINSITYYI